METRDQKEFIYLIPPAYYFKRAALFAIAVKALKSRGLDNEAVKMKAQSVHELALGFQSLVYQSTVPPA